jgi:hypothetical protein
MTAKEGKIKLDILFNDRLAERLRREKRLTGLPVSSIIRIAVLRYFGYEAKAELENIETAKPSDHVLDSNKKMRKVVAKPDAQSSAKVLQEIECPTCFQIIEGGDTCPFCGTEIDDEEEN